MNIRNVLSSWVPSPTPEEEEPLLPEDVGVYDLTDSELGTIGGASAVYDLSMSDPPAFRSFKSLFTSSDD